MPATRSVALFVVAALALVAIAIPGPNRAAAITLGCTVTVDSIGDDTTANTVVTLREAINFATDVTEPAAGELDEISNCPGDDDNPGAGRPDFIGFDATVFPTDGDETITINSALPPLKTSSDTVSGGGAVTVNGNNGDFDCFAITSAFNQVAGVHILQCKIGVDIHVTVVPINAAGGGGVSGNIVHGNVIVGNGVGVDIFGGSSNTVVGNMIGVDTDGVTALGNATGVRVQGFSNFIGPAGPAVSGAGAGAAGSDGIDLGNVISGNTVNGVEIVNSAGDQVKGNIIGLAFDGETPAPNGQTGVEVINSSSVHIGGVAPGDRNVISGNGQDGVRISHVLDGVGCCAAPAGGPPISIGTFVQGNYIGTGISGYTDHGNGSSGVRILGAAKNTIGGSGQGEGNVISGNGSDGVNIQGGGATLNVVQGNNIGAAFDYLAPLGSDFGVRIFDAPSNTVGGPTAAAQNVIVGNDTGVGIFEPGAHDNQVAGNLIGELQNGGAMGNGYGVFVQNSGPNVIGGPDAADGNTISNNETAGVAIFAQPEVSTRKSILSNAIYDNGGLGIDLEDDGVTLNDNKDSDTGANAHQNYPVLQSADQESGQTVLHGTLNSLPNTGFKVQFFTSPECDPSGFGEGKVYLGDLIVPTTDNDGNATIDKTFDVALGGQYITATATDPDGNTSEFSACEFVSGAIVLQLWGSLDCFEELAASDGLDVISIIAGLAITFQPPCPSNGNPVLVDGVERIWGDWNCDEAFDELDMLAVLEYLAGVYETPDDCPFIGQTVETTELS